MTSGASDDLYEVLQVSRNAEQEVIDAAYRRLSRKYHPDANPDSVDDERMKRINAAYAILRDPHAREVYDHERKKLRKARRARDRTAPPPTNPAEAIPRQREDPPPRSDSSDFGERPVAGSGGCSQLSGRIVGAIILLFVGVATRHACSSSRTVESSTNETVRTGAYIPVSPARRTIVVSHEIVSPDGTVAICSEVSLRVATDPSDEAAVRTSLYQQAYSSWNFGGQQASVRTTRGCRFVERPPRGVCFRSMVLPAPALLETATERALVYSPALARSASQWCPQRGGSWEQYR